MKVLITGANGFVGREIVNELRRLNFNVIRVGRNRATTGDLTLRESNEYFAADISNYKNLSPMEKIGKVDAVIHAAGLAHQFKNIDRKRFEAVNVRGTENVSELAVRLKARQFILISSTAVYGIKNKGEKGGRKLAEIEINEEDECRPETAYAESKLEAEKAARRICEKNGIALTILRLAPVIGENNVGNAARLTEALDGNKFLWIGDGDNLKTLIYKKDAARACALVLTNKKGGTEIFNLAAEPIKMADFVLNYQSILSGEHFRR